MMATSAPLPIGPAQELQPGPDLQGPDAEGGGGAEERGEDGQDVDDLAGRTVRAALAEQRGERRADQLPPAPPEGAVGDGQADDRVDRPRVQRPVEQRRGHGGLDGRGRLALDGARRRRRVVRQRLVDPVEHQPDAHAGAEHHRDPGDRAELRRLAVPAQRDQAVPAGRQPQHVDHEARGQHHEQPAEVALDPGQRATADVAQVAGRQETPGDEGQGQDGGNAEDDVVQPAATVARRGRGLGEGRVGAGGLLVTVGHLGAAGASVWLTRFTHRWMWPPGRAPPPSARWKDGSRPLPGSERAGLVDQRCWVGPRIANWVDHIQVTVSDRRHAPRREDAGR